MIDTDGLDKGLLVENDADIQEALEQVPEKPRRVIEGFMLEAMHMSGGISGSNMLANKVNEEHISQYLESSDKAMRLEYSEKKNQRYVMLFALLIVLLFIIVLIFLLKENAELLKSIVPSIISLFVGAFGGYGYGKNKRED